MICHSEDPLRFGTKPLRLLIGAAWALVLVYLVSEGLWVWSLPSTTLSMPQTR